MKPSLAYRFLKRLFDICASGLALIVLLPVWLIAIIGIVVQTKVSDLVVEGFNYTKAAYIITDKHVDLAILQSRSPTCGVKQIYDGTFSGTRIDGQGALARALKERGIPLMDAEDVPD